MAVCACLACGCVDASFLTCFVYYSLHCVALALFLLAAHRQHLILSSNFLASCLCIHDVWFKAYNAWEWWGGPETGGSCLWILSVQIWVIWAILNGDDVITIALTGSGKSMTYWIPLFIHKTWDYCCGYPIETMYLVASLWICYRATALMLCQLLLPTLWMSCLKWQYISNDLTNISHSF